MKKAIAICLVICSSTLLSAQEEEIRLKPVEKNWGFTFNLSGFINDIKLEGNRDQTGQPILFVRRYLRDDLALRAGFGLNTLKNTTVHKDSLRQIASFVEFDSVFTRNDVSFSAGIEKHIGTMRRLDPYFGGEILFQFLGKETTTWERTTTETAGKSTVEGEKKTDGGIGFGIFGIAGFNYFIADHISLGAEYRFGYAYLKTGGNFSESIINTPISGSPTNTFNKGVDEYRTSGFEVNSTANIILSIFF